MDLEGYEALKRVTKILGYEIEPRPPVPGETYRYIDIVSPSAAIAPADFMNKLYSASEEEISLRGLQIAGTLSHRLTLEDLNIHG